MVRNVKLERCTDLVSEIRRELRKTTTFKCHLLVLLSTVAHFFRVRLSPTLRTQTSGTRLLVRARGNLVHSAPPKSDKNCYPPKALLEVQSWISSTSSKCSTRSACLYFMVLVQSAPAPSQSASNSIASALPRGSTADPSAAAHAALIWRSMPRWSRQRSLTF